MDIGPRVGHVLGLGHVTPTDRLMMGGGTSNITNPPPDFVASEVQTMDNSPYSESRIAGRFEGDRPCQSAMQN
jgi:hypothetical protein